MALKKNNWYAVGIGGGIIALWLWSKYSPSAKAAAAYASLKTNSLTAGNNFQISTPALGKTLQSPESTPYMLTNTDLTVDPTTGLSISTGQLPTEPFTVPIELLDSNGVSGGY